MKPDGWTICTSDGSLSAYWEHTVAITEKGPVVLTKGSLAPSGDGAG
jgi:methionyl aminopeptidase